MRRRERSAVGPPDRAPATADVRARLLASAAFQGVSLDGQQIEQLRLYLETLLLWRERSSLVAQRDVAEIIDKHVEDSLAAAALARDAMRIADLGSGAGFPGMVIAITAPQSTVFLVDSKRRKASFLRQVVRATGASNARILEARAEDVAGEASDLDLVVSRAAWPGTAFFDVARPLLRRGGLAVAMKTPADGVPVLAASYAGPRIRPYRLSGGEERVLVIAEAL